MESLAWLRLYMPVFEIRFNYISLAIGVKKYLEAPEGGKNNEQARRIRLYTSKCPALPESDGSGSSQRNRVYSCSA